MKNNDDIVKSYNTNKAYQKRAETNKFSNEMLDKIIANIPTEGKFLDAGCGVGVFLEQLIARAEKKDRHDIQFYAFDYSEEMVKKTNKKEADPLM